MQQQILVISKLEEGLAYIKNYDKDLYNSILLEFQETEKTEPIDFVAEIKKHKILSPIVYDVFEKSNVRLELSSYSYEPSKNCSKILTKEKEVSVSGKYELIGSNCFAFSPQVETIIFEDGIKWISERACMDLKSLKTIYLPETLVSLDYLCFADCTALENVFFKNTNAYINPFAFIGTKWLEDKKDEFVVINEQLIKYNGNSKEVIIPEGIKSINFRVFDGNCTIEKVTLPASLEELGVAVFYDCPSLKEVIFSGEKLEIINAMTFINCFSLQEIRLPRSIKMVTSEAFEQATTIICHSNNTELVNDIKEFYPNHKFID